MSHQTFGCFPVLNRRRFVGAEGCDRWWTALELVYADDLVVGARGEIATIGGEAHGVYGSQVVAHMTQLSRLRVGSIFGLVDGFGRPYSDVTILSSIEVRYLDRRLVANAGHVEHTSTCSC